MRSVTLSHQISVNHVPAWIHRAVHRLQLLTSVNKTLLDMSVHSQIYLQTRLFLTSDLTGLAYFDYKRGKCISVVKPNIYGIFSIFRAVFSLQHLES